jgi:hypothetical protein
MPRVVIVEKNAEYKDSNFQGSTLEELAKKAGHKNPRDFALLETWRIPHDDVVHCLFLYGKTTGRAGQENKYEFPPPADNLLCFGNCIVAQRETEDETSPLVDLTAKEWFAFYNILYGGFEDLDECESELSEDDDDDTAAAEDGFIVESDEKIYKKRHLDVAPTEEADCDDELTEDDFV